MNLHCLKKLRRVASRPGWLFVAVYLLVCSPARAEIEERWLLVFDTSAEMKKRLPGVEATVKTFLGTSGGGQIHADDSVGVWTFCRQLHTGKFPLTTWKPERSSETISNLVKFVHHEWFSGETSLAALQPALNKVIADSDRLTVVIFCDGNSRIDWTPYDLGINQTFQQNFAERKKTRQPFVLLLRTQQGKFTGCTVNFPPSEINVPTFPPWPEPPKPVVDLPPPAPAPVPVIPKPTVVPVPALIIVGTHVGTNVDDLKKITAPATNPVAKTVAPNQRPTNPPKPTPAPIIPAVTSQTPTPAPAPTNIAKPAPAAPVTEAVKPAAPPTNPARAMVPPQNNNDSSRLRWWLGGGALLAVAVLIWMAVARSRRPHNSLITDSLNAPKVQPRKK